MPYQTTTLADFRESLILRWDGSRFWTDEEARLAINEVLREWNLLTGRWRKRVTIPTIALNPRISIATSSVYGMRVRTTDGQPLVPTSRTELDLARPQWSQEHTGLGGDVPTRPVFWAPESLQRIVIWPATVGISALDVDGISDTPVLVEEPDFVDIGEEHLDIFTDAALHVALFKEGGPRWQAPRGKWKDFLQLAAEENSRLKASQTFRRIAGLDRRRDLQPTRVQPVLAVGQGGGDQG